MNNFTDRLTEKGDTRFTSMPLTYVFLPMQVLDEVTPWKASKEGIELF
jgi:hypothetical protein